MVKAIIQKGIVIKAVRVLVMGLTFKKNCPDPPNTLVIDVVEELQDYRTEVNVHDPWVDLDGAMHKQGISLVEASDPAAYDAIILAVAHEAFVKSSVSDLRGLARDAHVFYDLRCVLDAVESDLRL